LDASRALMSTPASSSSVTARTLPEAAANMSGVEPVEDVAFVSAPANNKTFTTSA
jgi:hypothetical protein